MIKSLQCNSPNYPRLKTSSPSLRKPVSFSGGGLVDASLEKAFESKKVGFDFIKNAFVHIGRYMGLGELPSRGVSSQKMKMCHHAFARESTGGVVFNSRLLKEFSNLDKLKLVGHELRHVKDFKFMHKLLGDEGFVGLISEKDFVLETYNDGIHRVKANSEKKLFKIERAAEGENI